MAFYINKRSDPRIDFSNIAPSVGYKIKQVGLRALVEYRRSLQNNTDVIDRPKHSADIIDRPRQESRNLYI